MRIVNSLKKIFICFSLLICIKSKGQSLSPFVIAATGNFYSNTQGSLSFTVGEMTLVNNFNTSSIILLQGFQQPLPNIITSLNSVGIPGVNINFCPNPSNGLITLALKSPFILDVRLNVFDILGRQVKSDLLRQISGTQFFNYNWQNLQSGLYLVELVITSPNYTRSERLSTQILIKSQL